MPLLHDKELDTTVPLRGDDDGRAIGADILGNLRECIFICGLAGDCRVGPQLEIIRKIVLRTDIATPPNPDVISKPTAHRNHCPTANY